MQIHNVVCYHILTRIEQRQYKILTATNLASLFMWSDRSSGLSLQSPPTQELSDNVAATHEHYQAKPPFKTAWKNVPQIIDSNLFSLPWIEFITYLSIIDHNK